MAGTDACYNEVMLGPPHQTITHASVIAKIIRENVPHHGEKESFS